MSVGNRLFFALFLYISGSLGGLFTSLSSLHPHPPQWSAHQAVSKLCSWSWKVRAQNFRLRLWHDIKPFSFLLVDWESYTHTSPTAM